MRQRRVIVKGRVASVRIVPALDEREDRHAGLERVRRSAPAPGQFAFEGGKEAQSRARSRSSFAPSKGARQPARNACRRQSRYTASRDPSGG